MTEKEAIRAMQEGWDLMQRERDDRPRAMVWEVEFPIIDRLFEVALKHAPPAEPTSGLIEMQRLLQLLPKSSR